MWKSLFLKRFFLLYLFFANSFLPYFFGNGDVEEFDFFLPCICFLEMFFLLYLIFFGLETGRLVFFYCVFFTVGRGNANDSCRDFLGVDR